MKIMMDAGVIVMATPHHPLPRIGKKKRTKIRDFFLFFEGEREENVCAAAKFYDYDPKNSSYIGDGRSLKGGAHSSSSRCVFLVLVPSSKVRLLTPLLRLAEFETTTTTTTTTIISSAAASTTRQDAREKMNNNKGPPSSVSRQFLAI